MKTIELYSDNILEEVGIGKSISDFNKELGDYVKVELLDENNNILNTLYSNRLLLKYSGGGYYFGDYHYHPDYGFMVGLEHSDESHDILIPETLVNSNKNKKQFEVYEDDGDEIYIKPNEIIRLNNSPSGIYKIRLYFFRNIISNLSFLLYNNKNNLVENGNFLAGLEATQTGDLDRSIGKNTFSMIENPGYGKFVLEQDGFSGNNYNMRITGVKPNTDYLLSCWVAFNNYFNGDDGLFYLYQEGPPDQNIPPPPIFEADKGIRLIRVQEKGEWPGAILTMNNYNQYDILDSNQNILDTRQYNVIEVTPNRRYRLTITGKANTDDGKCMIFIGDTRRPSNDLDMWPLFAWGGTHEWQTNGEWTEYSTEFTPLKNTFDTNYYPQTVLQIYIYAGTKDGAIPGQWIEYDDLVVEQFPMLGSLTLTEYLTAEIFGNQNRTPAMVNNTWPDIFGQEFSNAPENVPFGKNSLVKIDDEIMKIDNWAPNPSNMVFLERGMEGTVTVEHNAGATILPQREDGTFLDNSDQTYPLYETSYFFEENFDEWDYTDIPNDNWLIESVDVKKVGSTVRGSLTCIRLTRTEENDQWPGALKTVPVHIETESPDGGFRQHVPIRVTAGVQYKLTITGRSKTTDGKCMIFIGDSRGNDNVNAWGEYYTWESNGEWEKTEISFIPVENKEDEGMPWFGNPTMQIYLYPGTKYGSYPGEYCEFDNIKVEEFENTNYAEPPINIEPIYFEDYDINQDGGLNVLDVTAWINYFWQNFSAAGGTSEEWPTDSAMAKVQSLVQHIMGGTQLEHRPPDTTMATGAWPFPFEYEVPVMGFEMKGSNHQPGGAPASGAPHYKITMTDHLSTREIGNGYTISNNWRWYNFEIHPWLLSPPLSGLPEHDIENIKFEVIFTNDANGTDVNGSFTDRNLYFRAIKLNGVPGDMGYFDVVNGSDVTRVKRMGDQQFIDNSYTAPYSDRDAIDQNKWRTNGGMPWGGEVGITIPTPVLIGIGLDTEQYTGEQPAESYNEFDLSNQIIPPELLDIGDVETNNNIDGMDDQSEDNSSITDESSVIEVIFEETFNNWVYEDNDVPNNNWYASGTSTSQKTVEILKIEGYVPPITPDPLSFNIVQNPLNNTDFGVYGWAFDGTQIGQLFWERRYLIFRTGEDSSNDIVRLHLGLQEIGENGEFIRKNSDNYGRRYFSDIRFEEFSLSPLVGQFTDFTGQQMVEYYGKEQTRTSLYSTNPLLQTYEISAENFVQLDEQYIPAQGVWQLSISMTGDNVQHHFVKGNILKTSIGNEIFNNSDLNINIDQELPPAGHPLGGDHFIKIDDEVMRISGWLTSSDTYNQVRVYRAQQGTERVAHEAGANIFYQNEDGTFG